MPHDVFVSYSVKDKVVADAIVARIEADGIRCWVAPRDVVPGADWGESIINAIEQSRIMVLVFTASANASTQIKREVERAVDKSIYTIPFRIDNIEPTRALEYFISTSQWMDAFTPPLEGHLDSLTKTVKAIISESPPLPSPPPEPPKKPPLPLGRWMVVAAVILLGALGSWYVATHRPPAPGPVAIETPTPTASATVAEPTASASGRSEADLQAAKEAQERAERDAELRAQLAATQARIEQMEKAAQQQANRPSQNTTGPWLFPDSSSRYLAPAELSGLTAGQLWQARNEIYARNGYRFSSPRGLAFARSLGQDYRGVDSDDSRVFSRMNAFEQANVTLIRSLEPR